MKYIHIYLQPKIFLQEFNLKQKLLVLQTNFSYPLTNRFYKII